MTAQADDLQKMRESSLSVWNEVIYLYEFQPSGTVYKNPELDTWKTLLAGEEVEAVIASIRSYLAVSYTHLDVYKRQVFSSFITIFMHA